MPVEIGSQRKVSDTQLARPDVVGKLISGPVCAKAT